MKNHYYLFLLFSISGFTHAQELDFIQYSDISSIPQIVNYLFLNLRKGQQSQLI